jgi:hypothetical protein
MNSIVKLWFTNQEARAGLTTSLTGVKLVGARAEPDLSNEISRNSAEFQQYFVNCEAPTTVRALALRAFEAPGGLVIVFSPQID